MRIAVVTHVGRMVGGVEAYLDLLVPALAASGHEVALWYDNEGPPDRKAIDAPPTAPRWSVELLGDEPALDALRSWKPDLIFSHGVAAPETERALLRIAPGVFFAHAYHGACISGWKSRLSPTRAPCPRALGWPCLLHYLPRRCGGLSPITMAKLYGIEMSRRDTLPAYRAILTASAHMRAEYVRYGLAGEHVHAVNLMVSGADDAGSTALQEGADQRVLRGARDLQRVWRLLFIGRVTPLKGVNLLVEALAYLRLEYHGGIELTVVGDGSARSKSEKLARSMSSKLDNVTVRFIGWLDDLGRDAALRDADLLVIPSIWPEPFGLVGPEAGLLGVPSVAFAVGGIPDWLEEGVNGHLAPGRRPRAKELAAAIVRALRDPGHYAALREGARVAARRYTTARHLQQILPILERAATSEP